MDNTVCMMMELIACEVCGKTPDRSQLSFSEDALGKLYRLAKAHDLVHLVGDALIRNDLIPDGEVRSKFDKQLLTAVYRYEKINYELTRLRSILNEAKIPFLPLKGSVLRQYYPEPWMRTSCDIDILVHRDEVDSVARMLVKKYDYREADRGSHDIDLFSAGDIHLELHFSLIEEKRVGNIESVLRAVWENAAPVDGTSEYILNDEMFYYYHIAHMAKHFVNGGCGIRPFLDIWVLNHRIAFDKEKRGRLLAEGGLLTFTTAAEALSEVWFGNGVHTDVTRHMQEYLLRGGIYGTTENRVSVQQARKGGKIRYVLSRIWLPYVVLKAYYPSLEGKRFLLPIYEARRWCRMLFGGRVRRSVNELKLNFATTEDEQEKARALLTELEIKH